MVTTAVSSASGSMPTGSRQSEVPLGSLQLGEKLGSGGEGEVLVVQNRRNTVFKRYFRPSVNAQSLRALADFPVSLAADDRDVLLRQSAWPLACVTDGAAAVGFLRPAAR